MGATFTIPTIFTAIDKFSSPLRGMGNKLSGFADKAELAVARGERSFRKLTPVLGETSKQLLSMASTAAIAGGVLAGGAFSVKAIMDYETALKSLQAVTGVSNATMEQFKVQIVDIAKESKMSSIDVTKSFETIGSMMSQYLEDPKALGQITQAGITLSKAARMELEPTLLSLTSVMNQFGLSADQANDTIEKLTAGEIVGSVRTSQIAEYLQEFGAGAKNANINVGESVALIEALGIQMKQDKIGIGARNILTVLDAAKGLDKMALKSLRKNGVDAAFLMDKTKPLGARLRELSKIQNDAIAVVNVFGKENKTAANVIFNQLGTYDKFYEKIQVTKKAEEQAALNSGTLSVALDQLKNAWVNMLTGSEKATSGLNMAKKAVAFVTDNLDTIVSVGTKVVLFFGAWKGLLLGTKAILTAFNIVQGISGALTGVVATAVGRNTVALGAYNLVSKVAAVAQWELNAAMLACPVGWLAVGVAGLVGAYLLFQDGAKKMREENERMSAGIIRTKDQETASVLKLAEAYEQEGYSKLNAYKASLLVEKMQMYSMMQDASNKLTNGTDSEKATAMAKVQEVESRMKTINGIEQTMAPKQESQKLLNTKDILPMDFLKKNAESNDNRDANIRITVNDPGSHLQIENDNNKGVKIMTTSTMPQYNRYPTQ